MRLSYLLIGTFHSKPRAVSVLEINFLQASSNTGTESGGGQYPSKITKFLRRVGEEYMREGHDIEPQNDRGGSRPLCPDPMHLVTAIS